MYVEERIYTFCSGKLPVYLNIYEEEGMAIQTSHLPGMLGYYVIDIGPLNTLVHLWGYDDLKQREQCRARLAEDPRWKAYLLKVLPLFDKLETRMLVPATFFARRAEEIFKQAWKPET